MSLHQIAPNFTAETSQGRIDLHEWIGDGRAVLLMGVLAGPRPRDN